MSFSIPITDKAITLCTDRVSPEDGQRQEDTVREILRRLEQHPGVILADEVGMGKTFVALGVAASVALARGGDGPVVIMVPPSLKEKWPRDWDVFQGNCLRAGVPRLRAARADSGVAFLRLLDDPPDTRNSIIFLTHGALNRSLTDEWVKLAIVRQALLRRSSLSGVRRVLPRFAGRLLRAQWVDHRAPNLWGQLLDHPPREWRRLMRSAGLDDVIDDDPVPQALVDAAEGLEFQAVCSALEDLPIRESSRVKERLQTARQALGEALGKLWVEWLRKTSFHSPLLVFDEAHHLKNLTKLSSLFAEEGAHEDSEAVSRGPLAGVFSRMLFLTATPFQLGHYELINVLRRFEGIAWDSADAPEMGREGFRQSIRTLEEKLDDAQHSAVRLEQVWGRLREDYLRAADGSVLTPEEWWRAVDTEGRGDGTAAEVRLRYAQCLEKMRQAEADLRPWIIRHRKPRHLPAGNAAQPTKRREVLTGAGIRDDAPLPGNPGLEVDGESLLPFLLAVRAQIAVAAAEAKGRTSRALFAEGLASSYEAYLETRSGKGTTDDDGNESDDDRSAGTQEVEWYLTWLDKEFPADQDDVRSRHPKVSQTINRVIELWWRGEKSLVFCHYRATGRALRKYISLRMEEELIKKGSEKLGIQDREEVNRHLVRLGEQFFDADRPLRVRAEQLLGELLQKYPQVNGEEARGIVEVALRFLRTPSFLVRYFPLGASDLPLALAEAFDTADASGLTLRNKLEKFCEFMATRCGLTERAEYLDALRSIQTGTFRRDSADPEDPTDEVRYLPNVRLANGQVQPEQRRRIMLAFNTPFFPEILIASSVLGEGVDLQMDCRFIVHHDLSWNPSVIEQRTGRVDRIGAKAEKAGKPIYVYLPFVTGTQDEKMFRVVQDRERWFSVVMGEKYQVDEQTTDRLAERVPFPEEAALKLAFDLSLHSVGQAE
jgi:hypothetical protein